MFSAQENQEASSPASSSSDPGLPAEKPVIQDAKALLKQDYPLHYYVSGEVHNWQAAYTIAENDVFDKLPEWLVTWLKDLRTNPGAEIAADAINQLTKRLYLGTASFLRSEGGCSGLFYDIRNVFKLAFYLHNHAPQSLLNSIFANTFGKQSDYTTGLTDLHWAIICRQPLETITYLKMGTNQSGYKTIPNPFICAVALNNTAAMDYLLKNDLEKTEPNSMVLGGGLITAAAYGHMASLNRLLAYGVCVGTRLTAWPTPMTIAVQNGQVEVVNTLIDAGPAHTFIDASHLCKASPEPEKKAQCLARLFNWGIYMHPPKFHALKSYHQYNLPEAPIGLDKKGLPCLEKAAEGDETALLQLETTIAEYKKTVPDCLNNWLESWRMYSESEYRNRDLNQPNPETYLRSLIQLHLEVRESKRKMPSEVLRQTLVVMSETITVLAKVNQQQEARLAAIESRFAETNYQQETRLATLESSVAESSNETRGGPGFF